MIVLDLKTTYKTNSNNKNIYDEINRPDIQVPEDSSEEESSSENDTDDNNNENDGEQQ